jgi:mannosyl-oligosaccharide alpha-1,2-mannosidase
VNSVDGGLIDDMQSFWFAEVLKYLYAFPVVVVFLLRLRVTRRYLTFDDPKHISLDDCK